MIRNRKKKPQAVPSINLPGEDLESSLIRIEAKDKRNERMRLKNGSSCITLDDTVENVENVDNVVDVVMDSNPSEPISKPTYKDLLDIIECQVQQLDLQKNTIVNLEQQLMISKPQVV